jgi:hypothetical protein
MIDLQEAAQLAGKLVYAADRVAREYSVNGIVGIESFTDQLCGCPNEMLVDFRKETIGGDSDLGGRDRGGRGMLAARSLTRNTAQ